MLLRVSGGREARRSIWKASPCFSKDWMAASVSLWVVVSWPVICSWQPMILQLAGHELLAGAVESIWRLLYPVKGGVKDG
jgi:hypothetical protein